MLRFTFEGTIFTDLSDCKADRTDLAVELVASTCGGSMPTEVLAWFRRMVHQAVLIEFDHFISAGQLADVSIASARSIASPI